MLKALLEDAALSPESCASLLGIDPRSFGRWVTGEKEMPGFIVPELAAVLGVGEDDLRSGTLSKAPAIWFKFRSTERLADSDRELILLIRRLGFYVKQLATTVGTPSDSWKLHFALVEGSISEHRHASPVVQGALAAREFRKAVDLGFSRLALSNRISGVGDVIRGLLRSMGLLVIEMPVPKSKMDGCSFFVGESGRDSGTPCLFVNTYRQKWFRRNYVLAHELGHAIFDIASETALIDYREHEAEGSVVEARANAFARHCFASPDMLKVTQAKLGFDWNSLSVRDLALLVAHHQVDLKVILLSAVEGGFITSEQSEAYSKMPIWSALRDATERALLPQEFFSKHPELQVWDPKLRTTEIPSIPLRLPVPYIRAVINAVNSNHITDRKAAELLMIESDTFLERFGIMLLDIAA